MKLRIVSDGSVQGTHFRETRSGKSLDDLNVYRMNLRADWNEPGPVECQLFCYAPTLDVEVDAEVIEVPRSLLERANYVMRRYGDEPKVKKALSELLGINL